MNPQENQNVSVSYREILNKIGQQLSLRKNDIFKRIVLISWPFVILAGVLYQIKNSNSLYQLIEAVPQSFYITMAIVIAILIPYYYLISFLVSIEKHLWIDSAFDNRAMDSKMSWHIAWKLIFPVIGLSFQVIVRYYLPAIAVVIIGFLGLAYTSSKADLVNFFGNVMWIPLICILLLIVVAVYFYLLRTRLRFIFFLFIDRYNKDDFSYSGLFQEMKKLNEISKTDGFKKALVINFGSDVFYNVSLYVLGAIKSGLDSIGGISGFLGAIAKPFAEESARQIASFARLTAIYLLYSQARFMLYNKPQEENKYIYSL